MVIVRKLFTHMCNFSWELFCVPWCSFIFFSTKDGVFTRGRTLIWCRTMFLTCNILFLFASKTIIHSSRNVDHDQIWNSIDSDSVGAYTACIGYAAPASSLRDTGEAAGNLLRMRCVTFEGLKSGYIKPYETGPVFECQCSILLHCSCLWMLFNPLEDYWCSYIHVSRGRFGCRFGIWRLFEAQHDVRSKLWPFSFWGWLGARPGATADLPALEPDMQSGCVGGVIRLGFLEVLASGIQWLCREKIHESCSVP